MNDNQCFECGRILKTKDELERQSCNKCFEKFCEIMKAHDEEIVKEIEEQQRNDNALMEKVKKEVSESFFKKLNEFLVELAEDNDGISNLEVVNDFNGEKYKSHLGLTYYINQWTVGDSGDSFAGYVYVKLPNKKHLRGYYEC